MIVSEARIAANQANSLKSRGPTTTEGKSVSRRNGLKHGLSGTGVVVPEGDQSEIDRRIEALEADLQPISEAGHILIGQMAILSVRADRASEHESATIAHRVRHAADDHDEERIEAAELLFDKIAEDPRNNHRKLRKSPEGVARLMDAWIDLREDLSIDPQPEWTTSQLDRAGYLLGLPAKHARNSRIGALSRGFWGDFAALTDAEGGGLGDVARRAWAKVALFEAIDAEIAGLEAHYMTLDFDTIDLDRAEAGSRSLFDPSKAATLARRYEAEARRGFFKALKEFRQVEAEFASHLEAATAPPSAPKVGSSRPTPPMPDRDPSQRFAETPSTAFPTVTNPENHASRPMTSPRPLD